MKNIKLDGYALTVISMRAERTYFARIAGRRWKEGKKMIVHPDLFQQACAGTPTPIKVFLIVSLIVTFVFAGICIWKTRG